MHKLKIKLFHKKIFVIFSLFIVFGCTENKKDITDNLLNPKISFEDQKKLKIDNKYFTTIIDSFPDLIPEYSFRVDIESSQLYRLWRRYYDGMTEVRFCNYHNEDEIKVFNYLLGIKYIPQKNNEPGVKKAFYIKWRNEIPHNTKISGYANTYGTSDICKYTVQLQSNLPKEIIYQYYPDLKCKIEFKIQERAIIKILTTADFVRMYENPFTQK